MELRKNQTFITREYKPLPWGGGGGGTPYNGPYWDAPPERGTFVWFEVYERVEISLVEV